MNKHRNLRVQELSTRINRLPIPSATEDAAFERFCRTGELPEYQRLALQVIHRAARDGKPLAPPSSRSREYRDGMISFLDSMRTRLKQGLPPPAPPICLVHEYLFREAVERTGLVRIAAREALRLEVDRGGNVMDPRFLQDRGLPKFGSLGLHLLGFPARLARRPYATHARRLFARYDVLREHLQTSAEWADLAGAAIGRFRQTGELPQAELLFDVVLANAELEALWDHARGQDVGELMAAFEAVQHRKPGSKANAIARVQALVRANYDRQGCPAPATVVDCDLLANDVREISRTLALQTTHTGGAGRELERGDHPLQTETLLQLLTKWDPERRQGSAWPIAPAEATPLSPERIDQIAQMLYEAYDSIIVAAQRRRAVLGRPALSHTDRSAGRSDLDQGRKVKRRPRRGRGR